MAFAPRLSIRRALPASQALGRIRTSGPACNRRKVRDRSSFACVIRASNQSDRALAQYGGIRSWCLAISGLHRCSCAVEAGVPPARRAERACSAGAAGETPASTGSAHGPRRRPSGLAFSFRFPLSSCYQRSQSQMNDSASTALYTGGPVHALDGHIPAGDAVVVRAGRVVGVGSESDMRRLAGPGAEHIDVGGATVMPGLIDTHPHLLHFGSFAYPLVDIADARSHADIVTRVRA